MLERFDGCTLPVEAERHPLGILQHEKVDARQNTGPTVPSALKKWVGSSVPPLLLPRARRFVEQADFVCIRVGNIMTMLEIR